MKDSFECCGGYFGTVGLFFSLLGRTRGTIFGITLEVEDFSVKLDYYAKMMYRRPHNNGMNYCGGK